MSSQWFYMQQWRQRAWERLLEHRTVRVNWDTDDRDQREILPKLVRIPEGIDLDNDSISNYLSNEYGYCVYDWYVSHKPLEKK